MTVRELIKKLQTFDPNLTVVVGGFDEEGYANINRIQIVSAVVRSGAQAEFIGEYVDATHLEDKKNVIKVVQADH